MKKGTIVALISLPRHAMKRRRLGVRFGAVTATLWLPIAAFSSEEPLPQTLESRQTPGAVWISAEAANTPEGEIRREAFSETSRYFLENDIVGRCHPSFKFTFHHVPGAPRAVGCATVLCVPRRQVRGIRPRSRRDHQRE